MAAQTSPITCHILDTIAGKPAANVNCTLTLLKPLGPAEPFKTKTDADGRVKAWPQLSGPSIQEVFDAQADAEATMVWSLRFDTEEYFGVGKTFFPYVEIIFSVTDRNHYHVPLLLGPWSYTTYRGS
jgi:5-hydroxyisourate hydrolase